MPAAVPDKLWDAPLAKIKADPDVQPRCETDEATAERYADLLREGVDLWGPRGNDYPVVFHDGHVYWLAVGFTRRRAHELAEKKTIRVQVKAGTRRDAILYAMEDNLKHGLPLKPADRKRMARILLCDEEWRGFSDREIARRCGLHHTTVGIYRDEVEAEEKAEQGGGIHQANQAIGAAGDPAAARWRILAAKVEKAFGRLGKLLRGAGPEGERALDLVRQAAEAWEQDAAGQEPEGRAA